LVPTEAAVVTLVSEELEEMEVATVVAEALV
jgi:hypothetical protein